ncbi:MAG TPA: DUF4397 domain-containing protein [Gemmatimonadaceae bacterium]|nr:DUF4397 domain-containing protein [Gemmatimonadaceae bacterium]
MNIQSVKIGILAALAFVMAGCGTKEATGPLQSGAQGRVRFVNLINDPARLPVNAVLENVPFGVNLGYGGTTPSSLPSPATANYSAILVGDRSLVLERTADPTVTVATLTFTIVEGADHTVYAQGGTGGGAITGFMTTDPTPAPPAGQVAVRIVNMSPTGGAMDFFVTAPNADLSTATPIAANLAYHGESQYVNLAAGTYQIRAVPAGTAPALRSTSVVINFTPPTTPAPFPAGAARTIVAADAAAGGSPLRAFLLPDR